MQRSYDNPFRELAETRHLANIQSWSEDQLVTAAQGGSHAALEELCLRYRSVLFSVLLRYTGSYDETEDLVQDVMLRAWQNLVRFRGQSRFSTWLVAIAINAAISCKRKAARVHWIYLDESAKPDDVAHAYVLVDRKKTPEQDYINKECRDLLKRKIRCLHPKYRTVLQRADIEGISIDDVAHTLGLTPGTVKSRLYRARRLLSTSLESYLKGRRLSKSLPER